MILSSTATSASYRQHMSLDVTLEGIIEHYRNEVWQESKLCFFTRLEQELPTDHLRAV